MLVSPKNKKKKTAPLADTVPVVFVVDDDELYLAGLGFYLKQNTDYKVYCYTNASECLQNLNLNPRLIVLDYYLSNRWMNGIDLLKRIKDLNSGINIVMLSGQETLQVATESLRLGAYTYMIKDGQAWHSIKRIAEDLGS